MQSATKPRPRRTPTTIPTMEPADMPVAPEVLTGSATTVLPGLLLLRSVGCTLAKELAPRPALDGAVLPRMALFVGTTAAVVCQVTR